MKAAQMIHTATRITPMIYAYTTPGYPKMTAGRRSATRSRA